MKKATLLAIACAGLFSASAWAQEAAQQEITYVEDPAQGYLFNRFKDNWFITAEGGANIYFSHGDSDRKTWDRFAPAAGLYVGKWFSPIIALRVGANYMTLKGLSDVRTEDCKLDEPLVNGKYKQKFNQVGPVFDAMLNLTNWWCGYHPGRRYNAIFYAGAGGYWTFTKDYTTDAQGNVIKSNGYKRNNDRVLVFRAGLINDFRISDQVHLSLDIRYSGIDNHKDEEGEGWNRTSHDLAAFLGVTYLFNKREWSAPVVPVCPPAENCDAYRARLQAANDRIKDLEDQLKDCLNKPVPEPVVEKAPLATIYYPINIFRLTKKDVGLLEAVAGVMKDNPDKKYVITGWADNYTGNSKINERLRWNRVNGVKKQLIRKGVPESQLDVKIDNANLVDLGDKYAALGRATTIEEAE